MSLQGFHNPHLPSSAAALNVRQELGTDFNESHHNADFTVLARRIDERERCRETWSVEKTAESCARERVALAPAHLYDLFEVEWVQDHVHRATARSGLASRADEAADIAAGGAIARGGCCGTGVGLREGEEGKAVDEVALNVFGTVLVELDLWRMAGDIRCGALSEREWMEVPKRSVAGGPDCVRTSNTSHADELRDSRRGDVARTEICEGLIGRVHLDRAQDC